MLENDNARKKGEEKSLDGNRNWEFFATCASICLRSGASLSSGDVVVIAGGTINSINWLHGNESCHLAGCGCCVYFW